MREAELGRNKDCLEGVRAEVGIIDVELSSKMLVLSV